MSEDNRVMSLCAEHATPDMWKALSVAQGQCRTVGKDGKNRNGNYNYASADAIVRASREPLARNGLSVIESFAALAPPEKQPEFGRQYIAARVVLTAIIGHESGGYITATLEMDAIGSAGRPPDKAIAAARTYAKGFLLLGLLNMDRDEEEAESVDSRSDEPVRQAPKAKTLAERMTLALAAFAAKGVEEPAVLEIAGIARRKEITSEGLDKLRSELGKVGQ